MGLYLVDIQKFRNKSKDLLELAIASPPKWAHPTGNAGQRLSPDNPLNLQRIIARSHFKKTTGFRLAFGLLAVDPWPPLNFQLPCSSLQP